jgi:hypothetical protein
MGYFSTLAEAQKWLSVLRRAYPSAFVSEAPGKRPRERAAAAHADARADPGSPSGAPHAMRRLNVPTLHAAPAGIAHSAQGSSVRGSAGARNGSRAALNESGDESHAMRVSVRPHTIEPGTNSLTDTQVLAILEKRCADGGNEAGAAATGSSDIALLRPEDANTRLALRDAVARNAPVSFAVQLLWSVQPLESDAVPRLEIFRAYRLYTVSGSRDGRTWYCVRLGFFSDAISARQVAHYVRSTFASAAVVPISPQERARAIENGRG